MSKKHFGAINVEGDPKKGLEIAKQKLYEVCDPATVLFLSGGTTPKPLYEDLAKEGILKVGAVAMVDERAGKPFHSNSNEKMIKETGLLSVFEKTNVPFYPVLKQGLNRLEAAEAYDESVRTLLYNFGKHVAILGIGPDGHTAGLPASAPGRPRQTCFASQSGLVAALGKRAGRLWQAGIAQDKTSFVTQYNDTEGIYGERITLTFNALAQMDLLIILAFGANKKEALDKMFKEGPLEEIPARFYLKPDIVNKTLLITDQQV